MLPWVRGEDGDALRLDRDMHLRMGLEQARRALTMGILIGTELGRVQWVVWDLRWWQCHSERE